MSLPTTNPARSPPTDPPARAGGALAVVFGGLAMAAVLATYLALMGIGFELSPGQTTLLLAIDAGLILGLAVLVGREILALLRARRAGQAGARLHARVVRLFSLIAAVPPVLVATAALYSLEKALDPWFSGDLRALAQNADVIARQFQQQLCQNIGREMKLMGADIDRAKASGAFEQDRAFFRAFMTSRANFLGFPYAALVERDGTEIERADIQSSVELPRLQNEDFELAASTEPPCLISRRAMGGVIRINSFADAFLVVARPVDQRAIDFPLVARAGVQQYQVLEARRDAVRITFIIVFALMTLVVLLAAILSGLAFADRLVDPIRRLIQATDQVSSGNLYVQVPIKRDEGDLSHLGQTFNNMTSVLRNQNNSLITANELIDRRRQFMEAMLASVPVGVVALDREGRITLVNATAETILVAGEAELLGTMLAERLPDLGPALAEAGQGAGRPVLRQTQVRRGTSERTLSVRVTRESGGGHVVTLDDISDLVTAQRTSAWADVARRIAHEIKNPLTPIQLSAERIRRKFGKVIVDDRQIFDQCTDTIVRQVEDIKRMVDEFSSFARMPKPRPEEADLAKIAEEVVFLMRVAHPDVVIDYAQPSEAVPALLDRRLIAQALQNIIKNAAEAIQAGRANGAAGHIIVSIDQSHPLELAIDVVDNGKGFPRDDRARLLEPYMTTREGGSGLGLPIVAKILEEHGGRIELLDAPAVATGGQGARVRMVFARAALATIEGALRDGGYEKQAASNPIETFISDRAE